MTTNSHSSNLLQLKVTPNARRSEITGFSEGVLQVRIAAPPVKGKANRELTALVSRILGVKKSAITIVRGQTSRNKVISIEGLSGEDIMRRLTD